MRKCPQARAYGQRNVLNKKGSFEEERMYLLSRVVGAPCSPWGGLCARTWRWVAPFTRLR